MRLTMPSDGQTADGNDNLADTTSAPRDAACTRGNRFSCMRGFTNVNERVWVSHAYYCETEIDFRQPRINHLCVSGPLGLNESG